MKNAYNVPLFGDSAFYLICPDDDSLNGQLITPPEIEDLPCHLWGLGAFCMDRHGNGTTNLAFMDFSARRVGLKELWVLKWNRNFNTSNRYTSAGGATSAQWGVWAPWMKNFKDY